MDWSDIFYSVEMSDEWQYGNIYMPQKSLYLHSRIQYPAAILIFPSEIPLLYFSEGIFFISIQLFIYFSLVYWMIVKLGYEQPYITLKFRFRKNINECKLKTYSN